MAYLLAQRQFQRKQTFTVISNFKIFGNMSVKTNNFMVMTGMVVITDVSECCIINSMSVGPERLSSVRLDIPLCFSLTD